MERAKDAWRRYYKWKNAQMVGTPIKVRKPGKSKRVYLQWSTGVMKLSKGGWTEDLPLYDAVKNAEYLDAEKAFIKEAKRLEAEERRHEKKVMKKAEYEAYLQSDNWRIKCHKVHARAHGGCEWCGDTSREIHHLHYDRLGHERLTDLIALCRRCHKEAHEEQDF